MTALTRLTPGSRAYQSGDKSAHVIRSVDARFAFPWCSDAAGIALLVAVDGSPEAPKLAREGMPTCGVCRDVMDVAAAYPSPGQMVRMKRVEREWTQVALGRVLGRSARFVSEVESGRNAVSVRTALQLEAAFGVAALEWLRLQNLVDLERARRAA